MGLVQDGEGGGQLVVGKMDLEQMRMSDLYTHAHSALYDMDSMQCRMMYVDFR